MTTRAQVIHRQMQDQTIGIRAVNPSVSGIANERRKRLTHAMKRAVAAADTIHAVATARDSGEPEAKKLALMLINSPEFTGAMIKSLESLLTELKTAAVPAAQPKEPPAKADPAAPAAQPIGSEQNGADYPEANSANNPNDPEKGKGSGLPGADAAAITGAFSAYLKDAAPPDIERRAAQSADAEAAANRRAAVALANTPEDKTRAAFGLPPRPDAPSSLDAFYEEPREPARKDRPYDR